jgi:hypothetical protein
MHSSDFNKTAQPLIRTRTPTQTVNMHKETARPYHGSQALAIPFLEQAPSTEHFVSNHVDHERIMQQGGDLKGFAQLAKTSRG